MESKKSETRRQAFVLTTQELERIVRLFPDGTKIEIDIACRDIDRKYSSVEELLVFENPPDKQINQLFLYAISGDGENSTSMFLKNREAPFSNIAVINKGEEEYVIRMTEKLAERFSSMKPWYAAIAKHTWILLLVMSQIVWVFNLIQDYHSPYTIAGIGSRLANMSITKLFSVLVLSVVLTVILYSFLFLLNRIRHLLFPMGVFAIGQGNKRHKDREIFRTVVVIGFVVNMLAGVLIWWMSSR
jgi:hypothetical protein